MCVLGATGHYVQSPASDGEGIICRPQEPPTSFSGIFAEYDTITICIEAPTVTFLRNAPLYSTLAMQDTIRMSEPDVGSL